jgi:hypothetical protein
MPASFRNLHISEPILLIACLPTPTGLYFVQRSACRRHLDLEKFHDFQHGTVFIHKGNDEALLVPWGQNGQRPHVLYDDVPFHPVQFKVPFGIFQSGIGMRKPVLSANQLGLVPVVQEKVMEQSSSCRRAEIKVQKPADYVTVIGYGKTMVETGYASVLGKSVHGIDDLVLDQIFYAVHVFLEAAGLSFSDIQLPFDSFFHRGSPWSGGYRSPRALSGSPEFANLFTVAQVSCPSQSIFLPKKDCRFYQFYNTGQSLRKA